VGSVVGYRGQRAEGRGHEGRGQRAEGKMRIGSAKELKVYQMAYVLAMEIFRLSKFWPAEEKYSLTDQIRRSSRGACANLREAWAKRRYEAHFVSKLTDADGENSETDTWLDFARDCGYLTDTDHARLVAECREIGAMLGGMLANPTSFLLKPPRPVPSDP
jgi:four helix bundle protein